jgi:hypothetical protein
LGGGGAHSRPEDRLTQKLKAPNIIKYSDVDVQAEYENFNTAGMHFFNLRFDTV